MSSRRAEYLSHMKQAAADACAYVEGLAREHFMEDKRTQQAVVMNLMILGEAATKLMDSDEEFVKENTQIPWHGMRGMRNRIAHGYFEIDLDVVWDTVQSALPKLIRQLHDLSE